MLNMSNPAVVVTLIAASVVALRLTWALISRLAGEGEAEAE